MKEQPCITVAILLYGDHLALAQRCLESIRAASWFDLPNMRYVVGLNEVAESTRQYVYSLFGENDKAIVLDSELNIRKYPMMRRMFYHEGEAIHSDYIMWFDDDSYLIAGGAGQLDKSWPVSVAQMAAGGAVLGKLYTRNWRGHQKEWVARQPWYNSAVGTNTQKLKFATGGWWLASTRLLQSLDYPWRNLSHNGGDSMLGEACRHAGYSLMNYSATGVVAVNAGATGADSTAPRRGVSESEIGESSHHVGALH